VSLVSAIYAGRQAIERAAEVLPLGRQRPPSARGLTQAIKPARQSIAPDQARLGLGARAEICLSSLRCRA